MGKFSYFRKQLWKLYENNKDLEEELGILAHWHGRKNEAVMIFEIIIKFAYECSPIYYEGLLNLMDEIFKYSKVDYIKYFGKHLHQIATLFFYKGDEKTKIKTNMMIKLWAEKGVITKHYRDTILKDITRIDELYNRIRRNN